METANATRKCCRHKRLCATHGAKLGRQGAKLLLQSCRPISKLGVLAPRYIASTRIAALQRKSRCCSRASMICRRQFQSRRFGCAAARIEVGVFASRCSLEPTLRERGPVQEVVSERCCPACGLGTCARSTSRDSAAVAVAHAAPACQYESARLLSLE